MTFFRSQKGELALGLTLLSTVLILMGIITGSLITGKNINNPLTAKNSPTFKSQGTLSQSKLGTFILSNYSDGAQKIVRAGPSVIKVLDPQANDSLMQAVRDYKSMYPQGIVLMRVYVPQSVQYGLDDDPVESAQDFWDRHLGPEVTKLSASDKQLIDYLGGPNYNENFQSNKLSTEQELTWFNNFWIKLMDLMSTNGFKPNFGEFYVAGIDKEQIPYFVGALGKVKELGGIWSYHGYTLKYVTDADYERGFSLHYRTFYEYLAANHPDLANIKMVLTEGGVDCLGRPQDGWNGRDPQPGEEFYGYCGGEGPLRRGNADNFKTYLPWYDEQLKKDSYILGVTLFQIGDNSNSWKAGNLEPIADWLATYLGGQAGPTSTPGSPTPTREPTTNNPPASPTGSQPTTNPTGATLTVRIVLVKNGKEELWNKGKAQVYIAGPTERGEQFSVVMDVPGGNQTTCKDQEGHDFACSKGTINWAGAPRNSNGSYPGTASGSYSVQIVSLPKGFAPKRYPNPGVTVGGNTTTTLEIVEKEGQWKPPGTTRAPTPTQTQSYTNKDYENIIKEYEKETITALEVSRWVSQASRVPNLQIMYCYPPGCDFGE